MRPIWQPPEMDKERRARLETLLAREKDKEKLENKARGWQLNTQPG
jgi:hypothetical protein